MGQAAQPTLSLNSTLVSDCEICPALPHQSQPTNGYTVPLYYPQAQQGSHRESDEEVVGMVEEAEGSPEVMGWSDMQVALAWPQLEALS